MAVVPSPGVRVAVAESLIRNLGTVCEWCDLCLGDDRNPDLDDRIFDCLLTSMAAVQAEDIRASLLFVGDLNGLHQEW